MYLSFSLCAFIHLIINSCCKSTSSNFIEPINFCTRSRLKCTNILSNISSGSKSSMKRLFRVLFKQNSTTAPRMTLSVAFSKFFTALMTNSSVNCRCFMQIPLLRAKHARVVYVRMASCLYTLLFCCCCCCCRCCDNNSLTCSLQPGGN